MKQQYTSCENYEEPSMSELMDGQLIARYLNADINSESYARAKRELEARRYHLEQIVLQMRQKET
ncbi:MAG: hypothetical protein PHH43_00065 [Candidatus Cloacimonetes bacterium]|jgi:hypothetical protein|nr:hypothetical protein [Candidatus Cloacimonadota bacterium]MDD3234704.1 hypothetical protein [Candidatus Cloacimonadota bacterium]